MMSWDKPISKQEKVGIVLFISLLSFQSSVGKKMAADTFTHDS